MAIEKVDQEETVDLLVRAVTLDRLTRWGYDKSLSELEQVDLLLEWTTDENLRSDIAIVVRALSEMGRLLPPDSQTRVEYGLEQYAPGAEGILMIGTGMRAKTHATHQREVTVWPSEGPNDQWARYITPWEPISKED